MNGCNSLKKKLKLNLNFYLSRTFFVHRLNVNKLYKKKTKTTDHRRRS